MTNSADLASCESADIQRRILGVHLPFGGCAEALFYCQIGRIHHKICKNLAGMYIRKKYQRKDYGKFYSKMRRNS